MLNKINKTNKNDEFMDIKKNIKQINQSNPYVDVTPYELELGYPFVDYDGIVLRSKEAMIFAVPAFSFSEKDEIIGYEENTYGRVYNYSETRSRFRGKSRSTAIRGKVTYTYNGDLVITNKRIIFIGQEDSVEFNLDEISSYKITSSNTFIIQENDMYRNIAVAEELFAYTTGFIKHVIDSNNNGIDIYEALVESDRNLTSSDRQLIKKISNEADKVMVLKPIHKKKLIKFIIAIFVLTFLLWPNGNNSNAVPPVHQPPVNQEANLSQTEFIQDENHPHVFDDIETVKAYYENYKPQKIMVLDGKKYSQIKNKVSFKEDDVTMYALENYKGEFWRNFTINIFDPEICKDIDIKDIELLISKYFPENFFELYDICWPYIQEHDDLTEYVCYLRYKEGVTLDPKYPPYFEIGILHFKESNRWRIDTDFSESIPSSEWLEKNTKKWDVNFNN